MIRGKTMDNEIFFNKILNMAIYCMVIFNGIAIGFLVNHQDMFQATLITLMTLVLISFKKGDKLTIYLVKKYL